MILDVSGMILDVSIQSVFCGSVFGDSFLCFLYLYLESDSFIIPF